VRDEALRTLRVIDHIGAEEEVVGTRAQRTAHGVGVTLVGQEEHRPRADLGEDGEPDEVRARDERRIDHDEHAAGFGHGAERPGRVDVVSHDQPDAAQCIGGRRMVGRAVARPLDEQDEPLIRVRTHGGGIGPWTRDLVGTYRPDGNIP